MFSNLKVLGFGNRLPKEVHGGRRIPSQISLSLDAGKDETGPVHLESGNTVYGAVWRRTQIQKARP